MPPAIEIQHRVEFYETDMAGIVHFSNFFRFMEAAEHAFYRGLGLPLTEMVQGLESGWPRVHASCDYQSPARFGDVLTIRLFIAELRQRSIRYRFEILRDEQPIATGAVAVAHVAEGPDGLRAVPIPAALRHFLLPFVEAGA